MKTLTRDEIFDSVKAIRGGTIARVTYRTEVPIKAEFKKQGYKIIKIVESSARFGVNYHNIASVINRKANTDGPVRQVTNNYEWIIKNRIKHNNKTNKDYLVIATLPGGHNTRVKYVVEGSVMGTLDMGSEIDGPYKNMILDSYFKRSEEYHEIRTISFDNIIAINKTGVKVNF